VTVIDGATLSTTTVTAGQVAEAVAVNTLTNKIYVANRLDNTVTVIDGSTLSTTSVPVGLGPDGVAVNQVTDKIYVLDSSDNTLTIIDGSSLSTQRFPLQTFPMLVALDSITNKIYVPSAFNNIVTVIDGVNLSTTNLAVGEDPLSAVVDEVTGRIYVANFCGNLPSCGFGSGNNGTVSVIDGTPPTALQFVPLTAPCRAVDTRPEEGGGGPIQGGTFQNFPIQQEGNCNNIPPAAAAYSMNVSVVPLGPLGYLTVWPAGQPRPLASTLNSLDGRIKANAAIVPAGAGGAVSVYATNTTNVILDIDGYFAPVTPSTLAFYPLPPCRVADTRHGTYPPGLGPPYLTGNQERDFPILNATTCNIPSTAVAYLLNFAVVPHGPLGYMTVWPTGQPRPLVSTLNDIPGQIIANAAIVGAGTSSEVAVYPTNDTDLVIDIDGYFAPTGLGGLSLYGVQPCRVIDTRKVGSGQPFNGTLYPPVDVVDLGCAASSLALAYVLNASVVPTGPLGYLTLWPNTTDQPVVSTLNALDGSISSNMAIVPTNNGKIDAYASGVTQLILDISSYFAP
jgi:YVTN family beta-propeller protein